MNTPDAIRLTCEHCGQSFRVKSIAAGRSVKCPGCSKPVAVPAPTQVSSPTQKQVETPAFTAGAPATAISQPESLFDDLSPLDLANALDAKAKEIPDSSSPYQAPVAMPALTAAPAPRIRASTFTPRHYPALQIVRFVLRVLAYFMLAICLILVVIVITLAASSSMGPSSDTAPAILGMGMVSSLTVSAPLLLAALILFSYAELITVFMDIQKNTQESAHCLRRNA